MTFHTDDWVRLFRTPRLERGTLVLSFTGWMDGGDVSTGTVARLIDLLDARAVAEIDPEPFYIYNIPGSMEIAALFRPPIKIDDGRVAELVMPRNVFYASETAGVALFIGKEPNLLWRTFGECVFRVARSLGVEHLLFVGSFGGSVPHTRQPRLFVTCSDPVTLAEMDQYGVRRSGYEGPGSFTSYLMTQAPAAGMRMTSLAAEIPGYLQGTNPLCIEAVTRRLAKILRLALDLDSLRRASTEWELQITSIIEQNPELAAKVRELEDDYDRELLEDGAE